MKIIKQEYILRIITTDIKIYLILLFFRENNYM